MFLAYRFNSFNFAIAFIFSKSSVILLIALLFPLFSAFSSHNFDTYVFFYWIPPSIAEAAAVIPNEAKTFDKGITTVINEPVNLLNNYPKNPLDWIILEIWALESFKSVDILLLKAFLCFAFCCQ